MSTLPINKKYTKDAMVDEVEGYFVRVKTSTTNFINIINTTSQVKFRSLTDAMHWLQAVHDGLTALTSDSFRASALAAAYVDRYELLRGPDYVPGPDFNDLLTKIQLAINHADSMISATTTPLFVNRIPYIWSRQAPAPTPGEVNDATITTLHTLLTDVNNCIGSPTETP